MVKLGRKRIKLKQIIKKYKKQEIAPDNGDTNVEKIKNNDVDLSTNNDVMKENEEE